MHLQGNHSSWAYLDATYCHELQVLKGLETDSASQPGRITQLDLQRTGYLRRSKPLIGYRRSKLTIEANSNVRHNYWC